MGTVRSEVEHYLQWAADTFAGLARGDDLPEAGWWRSQGLRYGQKVGGLNACNIVVVEAAPHPRPLR